MTLSFDLLWKGMEVTTGAQREHRYDVLLKQAAEKGMSLEPLLGSTRTSSASGARRTAASASASAGC